MLRTFAGTHLPVDERSDIAECAIGVLVHNDIVGVQIALHKDGRQTACRMHIAVVVDDLRVLKLRRNLTMHCKLMANAPRSS